MQSIVSNACGCALLVDARRSSRYSSAIFVRIRADEELFFASSSSFQRIVKTPFELLIGLTYTRAGRRGRRRDRFMSFISGISVASIALGVAALIIVLSVVPHIEVASFRGPLGDWRTIADDLLRVPGVRAAAPFVQGQGLFSSGEVVRGVCQAVRPAAVVAIDALAARSLTRLGCTVQLADTGIAPGSGIGNNRRRLDRELLGVREQCVSPRNINLRKHVDVTTLVSK